MKTETSYCQTEINSEVNFQIGFNQKLYHIYMNESKPLKKKLQFFFKIFHNFFCKMDQDPTGQTDGAEGCSTPQELEKALEVGYF